LLLGAIGPRAWQLMLIENTKLHRVSFDWSLALCKNADSEAEGRESSC
jgi:hypothetical protein